MVSDSRACFPRAASVRAQISFLRSVVLHWLRRTQSCANHSSGNAKDVLLTGSTLAQTSCARGPLCHECAGWREHSAARRECSSESNVCTRRTLSHYIVLACAPIAQMQAAFSRKLVAPLRGLLSHAVQAIEIVSSRAGRSAQRVMCARAEAVCLCIVLAHAAHSL